MIEWVPMLILHESSLPRHHARGARPLVVVVVNYSQVARIAMKVTSIIRSTSFGVINRLGSEAINDLGIRAVFFRDHVLHSFIVLVIIMLSNSRKPSTIGVCVVKARQIFGARSRLAEDSTILRVEAAGLEHLPLIRLLLLL